MSRTGAILSILAATWSALSSGCEVDAPEGVFACTSVKDCPNQDWHCFAQESDQQTYCYGPTTPAPPDSGVSPRREDGDGSDAHVEAEARERGDAAPSPPAQAGDAASAPQEGLHRPDSGPADASVVAPLDPVIIKPSDAAVVGPSTALDAGPPTCTTTWLRTDATGPEPTNVPHVIETNSVEAPFDNKEYLCRGETPGGTSVGKAFLMPTKSGRGCYLFYEKAGTWTLETPTTFELFTGTIGCTYEWVSVRTPDVFARALPLQKRPGEPPLYACSFMADNGFARGHQYGRVSGPGDKCRQELWSFLYEEAEFNVLVATPR